MNLVNQQEVISHYLKSEIERMVEDCLIDSFHHQFFLLPDMGSKQKSAIIGCQRSPRKFVQFITSEKNRGKPEYQIFFEPKVLRYPTVITGYNQREEQWGNVIIDGGHRLIKMVMEGYTFISVYLGVCPMNIARWQQQYRIEPCTQ